MKLTSYRADLHMHSTSSDGILQPSMLVEEAVRTHIDVMAISDHDTFDGYRKIQGKYQHIEIVQACELTMSDYPGMHLLIYGCTSGTRMHKEVDRLSESRQNRARKMVELLEQHGMTIDYNEIMQNAVRSVGRPHIAEALLKSGYVQSAEEAFQKWIGTRCPCYVPHECFSFVDAVQLARSCGFIPVLAHPYEISGDVLWLRTMIGAWQKKGLMGVEVYHPSAVKKGFAELDHIARDLDLIVTGGSDFHRKHDKHGEIGSMTSAWKNAESDVQQLKSAMRKAKKEYENVNAKEGDDEQ